MEIAIQDPKTLLAFAYESCIGKSLPDDLSETLPNEVLRDLVPASQKSILTGLRHWMAWWSTQEGNRLASSATALEDYFRALEASGIPPRSIAQKGWAIRRLLSALSWPDPDAELVTRGVRRAMNSRMSRARLGPPRATPMGWPQIKRLIASTDKSRASEVTALAAVLFFYDTMARFDQVFGVKHKGRWILPPAYRRDLHRRCNGGSISLGPDSRGRGKYHAHLSHVTMKWLERYFLLCPGDGPLFRSASGAPWSRHNWETMFKRLLARHGLRGYSPSSLRWGRARELLQKGVHVLDIQEFVGWNTLRPVLRLLPRSETPIPGLLLNYDAEQFQLPDPRQRLSKDRLTGDLFEGASSTRGMGSSSSV